MTCEEFNQHIQRIGKGATKLAPELGINQTDMLRYMNGKEEIPYDVAERIATQPDHPTGSPKD